MVLDILLILTLLYALVIVACAFLAAIAHYPADRQFRPTATIVIAARNEEENIGRCLESLVRLTYPRELLEIIIVDDRSTDRTAEIIGKYGSEHPHIRVLSAEPGSGLLRGKANAVTQGIEATKGEIILLTDADCIVPPSWVEETVKYFADSRVGIVAGFTYLEGKRLFSQMQALDWFGLFSVAAAGVRVGLPITAVGTNLHVRRTAYEKVGGYRGIPFSVTEDYALFHAVTERTDYVARFPIDPGMLVDTRPSPNWKSLYHQKKRWFVGGIGMATKYILFFAVLYTAVIFSVACIPAMWQAGYWIPLLVKLSADAALLLPSLASFRKWSTFRAFPLFEFYFSFYVILYPPIVLFKRGIVWKERSFHRQT
jgi:cellulose synthase/poly-beta-1,6-N-acetylglucosamine synthase-like glycosyltransferase